jgi:hypothetical protein
MNKDNRYLDATGIAHLWKRFVSYFESHVPKKVSDLIDDTDHHFDGVLSFNGQKGNVNYQADVLSVNGKKGNVNIDVPTALSNLTEDTNHRTVTDAEKTIWHGKSDFSGSYNDLTDKPVIPDTSTFYVKPSTGIPETDLSQAVQSSLNKANTALQAEVDPTVPTWAKQPNKPTYTAEEVGALPSDTPLFSGSYNDLTDKPTIPSQVTESTVAGWGFTKNTGTYSKPSTGIPASDLASGVIPDISTKEDKMDIVTSTGTSLSALIGKYYIFTSEVNTLSVGLPTVVDAAHVYSIVLYMTTGESPNITFTSSHPVLYQEGFSLDAGKTYEINCLFNGAAWVLMAAEINTTS